MAMFYDTGKDSIYQELKYIYEHEYKDQWDSPDGQINFVMDVIAVLNSMFGE